jgi:lipopolysaccharide export system permease protein
MNRLPRHASRYVARSVLASTLLVWAVLSGFDIVVAFANEIGDVGKENYSLGHAVLYTLFTIPRRLYDMFPTVAVIGSLLGLGGLAARSELTALRAVGVSKLQIGVGALLPLLALMLAMAINIETLAPFGEQRAQAIANAKSRQLSLARYSGLWVREGNLFFNARNGAPRSRGGEHWIQLEGVRLYQFDDKGKLLSLAQARQAEHRKNGWTLIDGERVHFLPRAVKVDKIDREHWDSRIDDRALESTLARPRVLSSRELRNNIDYLKRNQLNAWKFESAYWGRWFYPLKVVVLCLATLPFAFGSLRSGGFGKRLFLGILLGIGYLLLEQLFVNLADVYRFDVRWAYLISPALSLALCWGWLAKRI